MPFSLQFFKRIYKPEKDTFPFLDPKIKEVKGIQKKGQDRDALINP